MSRSRIKRLRRIKQRTATRAADASIQNDWLMPTRDTQVVVWSATTDVVSEAAIAPPVQAAKTCSSVAKAAASWIRLKISIFQRLAFQ